MSRFGGVPTSVVVPPRMEPKASGIIIRDGATRAWCERLTTAGISTAAAAMLFMKALSRPATSMTAMISGTSRLPTILWIWAPITAATPVYCSAALTKKTESIVITALEAKPVKASSGLT